MTTDILILSVGTRNKIVEYFKENLKNNGNVIAADSSGLAPALYEADYHYIVPKITNKNYLNEVLDICKKHDVDGLVSLIDPELNIISRNIEKFLEIGVKPIISDFDVIQSSFNKYQFNKLLKTNGFNFIKSYLTIKDFENDYHKDLIDFPVFVKPVTGSASLNINLVHSIEELELLFKLHSNLIIQEFMNGTEYGVDVYIDMFSKEPVSIFIKEKLKMRAGETDKSVSVKKDDIFELVKKFVSSFNYKGVIDIDIFEVDGEYYISEVNPRFGGGYPHAHECGVNVPQMIINNLNGKENDRSLSNYETGKYMMKYSDLIIN